MVLNGPSIGIEVDTAIAVDLLADTVVMEPVDQELIALEEQAHRLLKQADSDSASVLQHALKLHNPRAKKAALQTLINNWERRSAFVPHSDSDGIGDREACLARAIARIPAKITGAQRERLIANMKLGFGMQ